MGRSARGFSALSRLLQRLGGGDTSRKTVSVDFGNCHTSIESSDTNRQHLSQSATRRVFIDTRALGRFHSPGGNVRLTSQEDVPEKTSQASVSGQPYGEMSHPQDRWFDMWDGGEVTFERPRSSGVQTLPEETSI